MEFKRKNNRVTRPEGRVTVPARPTVGAQISKPAPTPAQAPIKLLDEEPPKGFKEKLSERGQGLLASKRKLIVVAGLVLVVGYVGTHLPKSQPKAVVGVKGTQTSKGATELPRNQKPEFKTVLPAGKSIDQYGGWTRISPPDRDPVFAYADKLAGITITISEQPLPENMKSNTEEGINKLANDFSAGETLKVDGNTVHIGTSAKGPQSVIFANNGLLILIKSTSKIDNKAWASYISSLQ